MGKSGEQAVRPAGERAWRLDPRRHAAPGVIPWEPLEGPRHPPCNAGSLGAGRRERLAKRSVERLGCLRFNLGAEVAVRRPARREKKEGDEIEGPSGCEPGIASVRVSKH